MPQTLQACRHSLGQTCLLDFWELSCWFDSFSHCREGRPICYSLWDDRNLLLSERGFWPFWLCSKPSLVWRRLCRSGLSRIRTGEWAAWSKRNLAARDAGIKALSTTEILEGQSICRLGVSSALSSGWYRTVQSRVCLYSLGLPEDMQPCRSLSKACCLLLLALKDDLTLSTL